MAEVRVLTRGEKARIKRLARAVRHFFEHQPGSSWRRGNDGPQAFKWREDLAGACGDASLALAFLLQKEGFPAEFVQGRHKQCGGHCWVELYDHIIDITATQFPLSRKIRIIRKHNDKRYESNLRNKEARTQTASWRDCCEMRAVEHAQTLLGGQV